MIGRKSQACAADLHKLTSSCRKPVSCFGQFFHYFYLACQLPNLLLINFPEYKAPSADSQQCFPAHSIPMVCSALQIERSRKKSMLAASSVSPLHIAECFVNFK